MVSDILQLIAETWDFADPADSEARFQKLADAQLQPGRAMMLTQVARAQGLQRKFDRAHAMLDAIVGQQDVAEAPLRVLLALERGRVLNSSGQKDKAQPYFLQAWDDARDNHLDALAVDAAHMLAIVADAEQALAWNQKALAIAEASPDPHAQRWRASLHNNLGWTMHERREFDAALAHFQHALDARSEGSDEPLVLMARWCVARCLRSMDRPTEALALQQSLLTQWEQRGEVDGYVHEELAECLHALGQRAQAEQHFAQAHDILSQDAWLVEQEPAKLDRLKQLSGGYNRRP
jgi:tetratricopeptide (TPR) repeat protein